MREEIEKRRAEAAEKKKQMEEGSPKPAFAITPKGSSKVSFRGEVQKSPGMFSRILLLTSNEAIQAIRVLISQGFLYLQPSRSFFL